MDFATWATVKGLLTIMAVPPYGLHAKREEILAVFEANLSWAEEPESWHDEPPSQEESPECAVQNILNFASKWIEAADTDRGRPLEGEWARTLALIQEADELGCLAEGRANDMIVRAECLVHRAIEAVQRTEKHSKAVEGALRSAAARVEQAEARAEKAEALLRDAEKSLVYLQGTLVRRLIEPRKNGAVRLTR